MNWLKNSKIYASSKYKSEILNAAQSPINQQLVQQLNTIAVYPELDTQDSETDESVPTREPQAQHESESDESKPTEHKSLKFTPHTSSKPQDNSYGDSQESDDQYNDSQESDEVINDDSSQSDQSAEASTKIEASTFVTVEQVADAISEVPGLLSANSDTAGATHARLSSAPNSEFWVYYKQEVDPSQILDKISKVLYSAGYSYLQFNRVDRDSNAVIFDVVWVSSYFNPETFKNNG